MNKDNSMDADGGPNGEPRAEESYFETEGHFNPVEIRWLREIILTFIE